MFSQEGSSCVWNRPGPSLPSRPCRRGHGWQARSGQHLCSRSLLSVSLFFPNHRLLPLNHIVLVSFADPSANLPILFDSGIFYGVPTPWSWGRDGSKFPAGHQLPPSCGWFHIIFIFFFSHLPSWGWGQGGQGCYGNWTRICLPQRSTLPLPHISPSVSSIPWRLPKPSGSQLPLPYREPERASLSTVWEAALPWNMGNWILKPARQ